eukprot:CAMPEP_0173423598 /NCGR_PEP_ID=MMETSP1357-20121228/3850_1 /TAXON_ID=77926 /ORGANISM="Hemiselmis rufescens, Strain PCC563" /LENGTH=161 /DNA_ID=CAMNT_0014386743 /DNA_START=99 /DNA_END=584 /DNA_ORIENTATION=+
MKQSGAAPEGGQRLDGGAKTGRREALSLMLLSALSLVMPQPAAADSTGKFTSKRTAKNRYVPRIKAGLATLKANDDEAFAAILDDMVIAMSLYGQAQKRGEVPDKISLRLEKDVQNFKATAMEGDLEAAKEKFKVYFEHLPRDGKEPFGDGMAPPPPDQEE